MSILHTSEETRPQAAPVGHAARDGGRSDRQKIATALRQSLASRSLLRRFVLERLAKHEFGRLTVVDGGGAMEFGKVGADDPAAAIVVCDHRFYRLAVLGGSLGAAEAYIRGYWESPDLVAAMRVLARNADVLSRIDSAGSRILRPLRWAANLLRRNTRGGSRRNIAAHYDLSNSFFALMLDPTMTYSSGVFASDVSSLEEASIEKYDRICRKLRLRPDDRVVEIGTGWGGFAEHAARHYGCHVTTTTISDEQYNFAKQRLHDAGLDERVTLLNKDYRDLRGTYDKLVSIEMIEAVGDSFLPGYFEKCSELLKPNGMMVLQAITIPDHRFEQYRKSVDFIQRYIFPGGMLPSMGAMANAVARRTDFRFFHVEEFGAHYAQTLSAWRANFWGNIERIRSLGFDERFVRTWHYYLCYCETAFHERQTGVSQIVLTKPDSRCDPILV